MGDLFGAPTYVPLGADNAIKVAYASPKFGGLNVAVSYAPDLGEIADGAGNGDGLAGKGVAAGIVAEAFRLSFGAS